MKGLWEGLHMASKVNGFQRRRCIKSKEHTAVDWISLGRCMKLWLKLLELFLLQSPGGRTRAPLALLSADIAVAICDASPFNL